MQTEWFFNPADVQPGRMFYESAKNRLAVNNQFVRCRLNLSCVQNAPECILELYKGTLKKTIF